MRSIILSIVAAFVAVGCTSKSDALLTFKVEDPTAREVVVVCHNDIHMASLDENGTAELVMTGLDAAYAKVFYGRDFKWIYFEKDDAPVISFNGRFFSDSFTFDGKKASAVDYLNKVKLTALPDKDYALSFDEFLSRTAAKEQDAVKLMKANDLKSAGKFTKMEEGRIRYSYAATLLMHPVGHMMMAQDMTYRPDEAYYQVIESYVVEDEDWVDLDEYRDFVVEAAHVLDADNRDVRDLYPKTVAQMKYIADRFASDKVRSTLLHYLAATYVDRYGIDAIQDMENIYHTYVKDAAFLADYKAKYEKWQVSKPGRPSPDFEAVDLDGNVWTLEAFRGKYVYIDMWATWCGPCKREIPYLKALEEKFDGAEIVFLGLSVDRDKSKWEEMVKNGVLSGVQLYLGSQSAFQKAYNVDAIPRFILLDKNGVIINDNMSSPSSADTASLLESLDGIR